MPIRAAAIFMMFPLSPKVFRLNDRSRFFVPTETLNFGDFTLAERQLVQRPLRPRPTLGPKADERGGNSSGRGCGGSSFAKIAFKGSSCGENASFQSALGSRLGGSIHEMPLTARISTSSAIPFGDTTGRGLAGFVFSTVLTLRICPAGPGRVGDGRSRWHISVR
jgi:hypothetical protein